MNNANQSYDDFPEVGGDSRSPGSGQAQKSDKKGFQNTLYPNDSVTTCSGFINEIRSHEKNGDTLYFVRAGLIQGSRKNEKDEWEGDITNCDLLIGSTLKKWAESMKQLNNPFGGIRVSFVIRNLKFVPAIFEGKPVLNSRGILEAVSIGHLDH